MPAETVHLRKLIESALARGAAKAAQLPASLIVVDPRVRMKCQVPICKNYGRSLMCPPSIMFPKEFSEILSRYSDSILVQWTFVPDPETLKIIKAGSLTMLEADELYSKAMNRAIKEMTTQLNSLERDAMRMGYRFATAFSGGPCALCDECVGVGGHCRHPFMARPSMEAVGIDVIATASNAGLPIKYPAESTALLTGLLLVD
jgi:predicted metal-binding protein